MHSSEVVTAPAPAGPALLLQLGRMVVRARSRSPAATHPSTSKQILSQPRPEVDEISPGVEAQLSAHVNALWTDQAPLCIEVSLGPRCAECGAGGAGGARRGGGAGGGALLLERWTMRALPQKASPSPSFSCAQWLVNALRSQLHFSQLSAWRATLQNNEPPRRRKLSRETCNIKKLEANCDDETTNEHPNLNIIYTVRAGDKTASTDFLTTPTDHTFPLTDIGNNISLKVTLESLPRLDEIPKVKCNCPKRRLSKDNSHTDIINKLNDLTLGAKTPKFSDIGAINPNNGIQCRRLSIIHNTDSTEYIYSNSEKDKIVDDRMLTPCSENGKHKCNCDDESDTQNQKSSTVKQETKKIDEKRLKEIAKYKRRLRKESKLRKLCDSTSSEGDKNKEPHTSIPILQASRFDRLRAIGCYRNQTYLTLPATRIEYKSPFVESVSIPPAEFKKTNTIATQTDDLLCNCGLQLKCDSCHRGMTRSQCSHDLANDATNAISKKHKCDNPSVSPKCDINNKDSSGNDDTIIKRPKLRRLFPIVDRIERIVTDRFGLNSQKDIEELHLKKDDSVFSTPKPEPKRQKTFSIGEEDYVYYEKSDYGPFDRCELESPNELTNGFKFPEAKHQKISFDSTPSNSMTPSTLSHSSSENTPENDIAFPPKDIWSESTPKNFETTSKNLENGSRYSENTSRNLENMSRNSENTLKNSNSLANSALFGFKSSDNPPPEPLAPPAPPASFHRGTGLPLTSSPAPLRRGNHSFDFDDSINSVSGIKSALSRAAPPAPGAAPPRPRKERRENTKIQYRPNRCLLGSFEECLLQRRLESSAVSGYTAELCAAGEWGAGGGGGGAHARLPVSVFYYRHTHAHAPYMGHIDLGSSGYRVPGAGSVQLSLFNPAGSLVKMFVVGYELRAMPPRARTFLRQRTYIVPAAGAGALTAAMLRYALHLRFMTSKSGKLYLHTDIRLIVSRKADLDTATAHSAILKSISNPNETDNQNTDENQNQSNGRSPNRVFGGCDNYQSKMRELGYENQNGVAYELRSFTYAPDNPKYSPR